ncbi:MAG: hypothetical protein AAF433_05185 [Bacteroidota bacterium]
MKKIELLSPLFGLLLVMSCGNTGDSSAATAGVTVPPAEVQNNTPTQVPQYPSISIDRLEYLWNNATYMDVVFYQLPVSLNQSDNAQIRSTIAGVGEKPPVISPNCQSIGRIFFQVGSENVEQAEIYFNEGCTYYVWLENDQPAYANEMTDAAIGFYNNIFQQVQSAGQQLQGQ